MHTFMQSSLHHCWVAIAIYISYIYIYIDICTCWCFHDLIILYASLAAKKHRKKKTRLMSPALQGRIEGEERVQASHDHPRVKWVFHAKKDSQLEWFPVDGSEIWLLHQVEGKVVYRNPILYKVWDTSQGWLFGISEPSTVYMSSVIYFRHNDMQDCVIKLGKWYRTAVAEARGRLFVFCFFCGSSRKQMLCNRFLHIIHSLDISFLYLKILAIRSWPSRKYRNCMLKETSISLYEICGRSAEAPRKG